MYALFERIQSVSQSVKQSTYSFLLEVGNIWYKIAEVKYGCMVTSCQPNISLPYVVKACSFFHRKTAFALLMLMNLQNIHYIYGDYTQKILTLGNIIIQMQPTDLFKKLVFDSLKKQHLHCNWDGAIWISSTETTNAKHNQKSLVFPLECAFGQ